MGSLHTLPPYLPQDSVKGQLLIALEHGACDTGSCLHALSVFLGNTHIQLRYSGSSSASLSSVLWGVNSAAVDFFRVLTCLLSTVFTLQTQAYLYLPSTHPLWVSITIPSRFLQLNLLLTPLHAPVTVADTLSQGYFPRHLLLVLSGKNKLHS